MPETYPAILKGDRLEWIGEAPGPEVRARSVAVEVTIVRAPTDDPVKESDRRRRMIEALERLAARGAFSEIEDPADWQREVRQDRALPGREP